MRVEFRFYYHTRSSRFCYERLQATHINTISVAKDNIQVAVNPHIIR